MKNILGVTIYILERGKLLKLEIEISTFIKNSNVPDKNLAKVKLIKDITTTNVPKIVSGPSTMLTNKLVIKK